jgi:hypothetical protein
LAKMPRLAELTCTRPRCVELEQLLAMAAAAQPSSVGRVHRLVVRGVKSAPPDEPGSGLPALLRSLAHLPGLQVCHGFTCSWWERLAGWCGVGRRADVGRHQIQLPA